MQRQLVSAQPEREELLLALVEKLVSRGRQVIVFRSTVRSVHDAARRIRDRLPAAGVPQELDIQLNELEQSDAALELRRNLAAAVGFHNTDLTHEERRLAEDAFRSGQAKVLVSTTTLSMGVNLPCDAVIVADSTRPVMTPQGRWSVQELSVGEYRNAAGRAGRLGKRSAGTAILLAENEIERRQLVHGYLLGRVEAVTSQLPFAPFSNIVFNVLCAELAESEAEIVEFVASMLAYSTFYELHGGLPEVERAVAQAVEECVNSGLAVRDGAVLRPTPLAIMLAGASLSFAAAVRIGGLVPALAEAPLVREGAPLRGRFVARGGRPSMGASALPDGDRPAADALAGRRSLLTRLGAHPHAAERRAQPRREGRARPGPLPAPLDGRREPPRIRRALPRSRRRAVPRAGTRSQRGVAARDPGKRRGAGGRRPGAGRVRPRARARGAPRPARAARSARAAAGAGNHARPPAGALRREARRAAARPGSDPRRRPRAVRGPAHATAVARLKQAILADLEETLQRRRAGHAARAEQAELPLRIIDDLYSATGGGLEQAVADALEHVGLSAQRVLRQPHGEEDVRVAHPDGTVVISVTASQGDARPVKWNKVKEVLGAGIGQNPTNYVCVARPGFDSLAERNAASIAREPERRLLLIPATVLAEAVVRCSEERMTSTELGNLLARERGLFRIEQLPGAEPATEPAEPPP